MIKKYRFLNFLVTNNIISIQKFKFSSITIINEENFE